MTEQQGQVELEYRLCKIFLRYLREDGTITPIQEQQCRAFLLKKMQPFISSLEGDVKWEKEK